MLRRSEISHACSQSQITNLKSKINSRPSTPCPRDARDSRDARDPRDPSCESRAPERPTLALSNFPQSFFGVLASSSLGVLNQNRTARLSRPSRPSCPFGPSRPSAPCLRDPSFESREPERLNFSTLELPPVLLWRLGVFESRRPQSKINSPPAKSWSPTSGCHSGPWFGSWSSWRSRPYPRESFSLLFSGLLLRF